MDNKLRSLRVAILTAFPVERQEVCKHLQNLKEDIHPEGTVYWKGTFPCVDCTWDVKVAEIGSGNPRAAFETERAISYIKPNVTLFIGVAGGVKDVQNGDVVAATMVYGYESGKADVIFQPRPEVGSSTYRMEQRARAEAGKKDWLQRLQGRIPIPEPRVYVAPIAAGEQVISSTSSKTYKSLRKLYSNVLAVEMEGYGFLQAVHANQLVNALVIRGISDLIDHKSEADSKNSQELASRNACAFAFEILAKLGRDKQFIAMIDRTKPKPKERRQGVSKSKYSITNSGQMPAGDHARMTINWHQGEPS